MTGSDPFLYIQGKMTLVFLGPFCLVRGIGCVSVHVPHGLKDDSYFSIRELVTGMQLPDEFGIRLYTTQNFEYEDDYDHEMIWLDQEDKFNKLQDACFFLSGEASKIVKRKSARKLTKCLTSKYIIRLLRGKTHHHGSQTLGSRNACVGAYHF